MEAGNADDAIEAMVLIGGGRGFIAGADIKHLGKPRSEKSLRMREVIETSGKPIVAAIHGHALGGGLEVALLCNYRVAVSSAKVGLPEVLIGVIPGAGGTQRLATSCRSGSRARYDRHRPSRAGCRSQHPGYLDAVVSDDALEAEAIEFAKKVAGDLPPPQVRNRNEKIGAFKGDSTIFEAMRKKIARKARNQRALTPVSKQ